MRRNRRQFLAAVTGSIALAGCAGNESGADEAPADDSGGGGTDGGGGNSATVKVRDHPDLGEILVDSEGMTLYMFEADTKGAGESACHGGCADAWPPLTVENEPTTGDSVTATLTTFTRDDGSMQVAAGGWPLYYFQSDQEPGDAKGQGVNDVWWVLRPDGTPIEPQSSDMTSGGLY